MLISDIRYQMSAFGTQAWIRSGVDAVVRLLLKTLFLTFLLHLTIIRGGFRSPRTGQVERRYNSDPGPCVPIP